MPNQYIQMIAGNILVEKYFLYTKYLDSIHDLTEIIFTKLTYENKTLYFKFYQVFKTIIDIY